MSKCIAEELFDLVKQCVKDVMIPKPSGINEDLLADYTANREKPMLHWQKLNRLQDELGRRLSVHDDAEALRQLYVVEKALRDHHAVVDYMLAVEARKKKLGLIS